MLKFKSVTQACEVMDEIAKKLPCASCIECCCRNCAQNRGYLNYKSDAYNKCRNKKIYYRQSEELAVDIYNVEEDIDDILGCFAEDNIAIPDNIREWLESATSAIYAKKEEMITNEDIEIAALVRDSDGWHPYYGFLDHQTGCTLPRAERSATCLGYTCGNMMRNLTDKEMNTFQAAVDYTIETRNDKEK